MVCTHTKLLSSSSTFFSSSGKKIIKIFNTGSKYQIFQYHSHTKTQAACTQKGTQLSMEEVATPNEVGWEMLSHTSLR